jgi:hypothetical protein
VPIEQRNESGRAYDAAKSSFGARFQQPKPVGAHDRLEPIVRVEAAKERADVITGRLLGDAERSAISEVPRPSASKASVRRGDAVEPRQAAP